MGNKKLMRSKDRKLAGVCGGIAEYLGWDATMVRLIYVLLTVFTAFCGVLVYIILLFVMPEPRYSDGYENRVKERLHNR